MIAIKGMKMPYCCFECKFSTMSCADDGDELFCDLTNTSLGINNDWHWHRERSNECPLIETEPEHGRWIVIAYPSDPDYEIAQCSICGYENTMVEVFDRKGYHYCPDCGAKMDEVGIW